MSKTDIEKRVGTLANSETHGTSKLEIQNGLGSKQLIYILLLASDVGYGIAGNLGARAFIELELAYASRLLPRFADNPLIRVRQNVLLYWDQSYFKTTLINEFGKTIPESLKIIDVTSMSPQMIFGSISDDRCSIIRPAFANKHFALISELLSFIGSGNTMRDIVNTMNKVMEGETVTRQLLKLGTTNINKAQLEELMKANIYYDPHQAQLRYQPDVCIYAASRPMDNRTYTYLHRSGHLHRFHILQHQIGDEEAKRYLTENYHPNLELHSQLSALNSKLTHVSLRELRLPKEEVMREIFNPLTDIVIDEVGSKKQRLAEILDIRTRGDIIRELTAHVFLRTAGENNLQSMDSLEYTAEDKEFILQNLNHFVEFKLNPLYVEDWTQRGVKKMRPRDHVKEIVIDFLKDDNERARGEIIDFVKGKISVSVATIDNVFKELLKEERITSPRFGYYKISREA